MDTVGYGEPIASKTAERAVLRDVWIYTGLLFVLLTVVSLVLSGSLGMVGLVLFICVAGGLGITWITHIEFTSAHLSGRPARIGRVFE